MSGDDDMIPDRVLDAATGWAFRLQDAPDDAGLQAELADWLAESPLHGEAVGVDATAWQITSHAQPSLPTNGPPRQRPDHRHALFFPARRRT
jgi:ferric-dicitrate binding protein FerR (iron transport regulator)